MFDIKTKHGTARITGDAVTPELAAEILLRTSVHPLDLLSVSFSRVRAPLGLWVFRNGLFSHRQSWVNERGEFLGGDFTLTDTYPCAQDVVYELKQIAGAFPSLNLKVLIFDENKCVTGDFTLSDGKVEVAAKVPQEASPVAAPANLYVEAAYRTVGW